VTEVFRRIGHFLAVTGFCSGFIGSSYSAAGDLVPLGFSRSNLGNTLVRNAASWKTPHFKR
jgi:hypothetical protein